jgi:hypothetical protein
MPAGWFGAEALPLLKVLCQRVVKLDKVSKRIDTVFAEMERVRSAVERVAMLKEIRSLSAWVDRETKVVCTISYQLRLTPKSRGEWRKKDESSTPTRQRRPWEWEDS